MIHAHIFTVSTDCDGTTHFHYVEAPSGSEVADSLSAQDDLDLSETYFRSRVLSNCVPVFGVGPGGCEVKIKPSGDFEWVEGTDEGYRSGEVKFCDDNCDTGR